jgi:O-antigen/teichoic acid export membrane protein
MREEAGQDRGNEPLDRSRAPESKPDLDRRIVRNSLWVGVGYGGGQVLAMAAMLVLARLLTPAEFGVVALATTLVVILSHVQESGVGAALVHFRESVQERASSALVFSSASGFVLAALVVLLAPVYARFVRSPDVENVVRALSLLLAFRGLTVVPNAILERELDFRTKVKSEMSSYVVQAIVSVSCAIAGLGVWSLVLGLLCGAATQAVVVWLLVPWRPSPRRASWSTLRTMLRYGRFVSATNLMNVFNSSMDNLAVGRLLGSSAVGAYAFAWRLAELPVTIIGPIVGRVMFSVYSQLQHDMAVVRRAYVENLQRTVLLGLPATVAVGIAADPIVPALLGPQWSAAVTPLRILSLFAFVRLVAGPAGELFKGVGKPHLPLAATAVFTGVGLASLAILVPRYEAPGAAAAMLIAIVVSAGVTLTVLLRVLALPLRDLFAALVRPVSCSVPLAVTLLVLVPVTGSLAPGVALAVLIAVAVPVFVASVAVLGRPIVAPVVAALRKGTAAETEGPAPVSVHATGAGG